MKLFKSFFALWRSRCKVIFFEQPFKVGEVIKTGDEYYLFIYWIIRKKNIVYYCVSNKLLKQFKEDFENSFLMFMLYVLFLLFTVGVIPMLLSFIIGWWALLVAFIIFFYWIWKTAP